MFDWFEFRKRFPFGDLSIRQGDYQARVVEALNGMDAKQQVILLTLLDQQWQTFIIQMETLREEGLVPDLGGPLDDAYARLQMNDNLRSMQRPLRIQSSRLPKKKD